VKLDKKDIILEAVIFFLIIAVGTMFIYSKFKRDSIKKEKTTTITLGLLPYNAEIFKWIKTKGAEFENKEKKVKLSIEKLEFREKGDLNKQVDILFTRARYLQGLFNRKIIWVLPDSLKPANLPVKIRSQFFSKKGKAIGLPLGFTNYAIFINKDIIKDKPGAPKNWGEIMNFALRYARVRKGNITLAGIAFPFFSEDGVDFFIDGLVPQAGYKIDTSGLPLFSANSFERALKWITYLIKNMKVTSKEYLSAPAKSFLERKSVMLIYHGQILKSLVAKNYNFGVYKLSSGLKRATPAKMFAIGISKIRNKYTEKFIKYLVSKESLLDFTKRTYMLPFNAELLKDKTILNNKYLKVFAQQYNEMIASARGDFRVFDSEILKVFKLALEQKVKKLQITNIQKKLIKMFENIKDD